MDKKKLLWRLPFLALLIVGTYVILHTEPKFRTNEGLVFNTVYHITYQCKDDLHDSIRQEFAKVDETFSMFNPSSMVSAVNANRDTTLNGSFCTVFNLAQQVSAETNGCFDVTVAPLVNAWGFGYKANEDVDSVRIDSLRQFVGHDKVRIEGNRILKDDPCVCMDFSSIAKGYAVDCVANLLARHGINNFMVEIGGEVVVRGKNPQMNRWRVGINKPTDNEETDGTELQDILCITNIGLATSGNYRRFYVKDGVRYGHTIDPRTGRPAQTEVLSATVVAADCTTADAYATAFMVMGLEQSMQFCQSHGHLQAYFICSGPEGYEVHCTEGLKRWLKH